MADFVEIIKIKQRMCENTPSCQECVLNTDKLTCDDFLLQEPELAENILLQWAKEHPIITNAEKFKEIFGIEIEPGSNGCAAIPCQDNLCDKCEYRDFWEKGYIAPKKLN